MVDPFPQPHKSSRLSRNSLKVGHAIIMAIALMAPFPAISFNTIPQAGLVGAAIPLCYGIGLVLALLVVHQFSELAVELPTSGAWYTFVAQGLGTHWGFMTGWLTLTFYGLVTPASLILSGYILQGLCLRWTGFTLHWAVWFLLEIGLILALCCRNINKSLRLDLLLLGFEGIVALLLAVTVLVKVSQSGQLTVAPFNPTAIPAGGNIVSGIILAILSFVGFEAAATLGEETQNPRRAIPKALWISVTLVGLFYLIMSYVIVVGYGIDRMAIFAQDPAPIDTIAHRFLGDSLVFLVDSAWLLSGYAGTTAAVHGAARVIYAMSREGLLPSRLAWIHPTYKTPVNAVVFLGAIAVVIGIGLGLLWTPIQAYAFLGTVLTLAALIIYLLTSIACFRYFWIKRRDRFHLIRHGILPWVSVIMISGILVGSVYPSPPSPLNWCPWIILGWLLAGLFVLLWLQFKQPNILHQAGALFMGEETK
jgi:amino acid transporter